MQQDESAASILGARGGAKRGASTSQAKKAAAASSGAKGGRPHKPNLFIKFAKSVWQQPDPDLLNKLYLLIGNNTWLPNEQGERLRDLMYPSTYQKMAASVQILMQCDSDQYIRLHDYQCSDA